MRSHAYPASSFLLSWVVCQLFVYSVNAESYEINYGNDLGKALIEVNDLNHTAIITPASETSSPVTIINFKKSMMVYVFQDECLVSSFKDGEKKYKKFLTSHTNPTRNLSTFYVGSPVSKNKIKKYLGIELFKWCEHKLSSRLTRRKPKMRPTEINMQQMSIGLESSRNDHLRNKRETNTEKSKRLRERKGKSRGNRRQEKKSKKKERKSPETKSLRSSAQILSATAPRFEFPLANVPQLLTDYPAVPQSSPDHVVLQEEPYLSPSFVRTDDDGQGFRHYRDFYEESSSNESSIPVPNQTNRIISLDAGSGTDGQLKISIPETIVKDGQIFYRYDADDKGQSKRSHTKDQSLLDDKAPPVDNFEYYDYHAGTPNDVPTYSSNNGDETHQMPMNGAHEFTDGSVNQYQASSHVQTQAQIGGGRRGASAIALSGSAPGAHVLGNSDSDGFFLAQAHGIGHNGDASLTHVFGNKHGMMGTAMTMGRGHQSHAQVEMGAHPSSTAHVSTHGGETMLSSSVQATQIGGNARSRVYGNGASTSNAQMEFNPLSHPNGGNGGITGHGSASATVTNSGSAAVTSLSGQAAGGSYLGMAHSSIGGSYRLPSIDQNNISERNDGFGHTGEFTNELGAKDTAFDGISHSHYIPGNTAEALRQEDREHTNQSVDPNHMIGDIMETVHQPDMEPDVILYPASEFSIIDKGGLTGGAGVPPRESEIERAPNSPFVNIAESDSISTGGSKAGIVGLATYSHGRVGAPPGPGELLNTPQSPSYRDYRYYDNEYDSEYYDEDFSNIHSQGSKDIPFFDLGPEIDFEPLESNYENLQPMLIPTQYPGEQQELPEDYFFTQLPEFNRQGDLHSGATPDPPIVVHQVQALPILPDDDFPREVPESDSVSHYFSGNVTTDTYESAFSTTPTSVTESYQSSYVPPVETKTRTSQEQQHYPYSQASHAIVTSSQESYTPPHVERERYPTSGSGGVPVYHSDPEPGTHISHQTQYSEDSQRHTNEQSMVTIPLNPGVPGSMHSLPGNHGGPDVKVMTLSAPKANVDRSLLYQRPGTPIQPGEKIPGAPGYIVPPGFRGHVIFGQNLPVSVNSRKVVQGFNTHVQLSPQNPSSNSPVFASVSGPGASQHLAPHTNNPSIHITLGGGDTNSQSSQLDHSSLAMTHSARGLASTSRKSMEGAKLHSSQQLQTHAATRLHPQSSSSSSRRSWSSGDSVLPTKSWDSMSQRGLWESGRLLPTKSWDSMHQSRESSQSSWRGEQSTTNSNRASATGRKDFCKQYSMECREVYGPYERSKICKPVLLTIECCC